MIIIIIIKYSNNNNNNNNGVNVRLEVTQKTALLGTVLKDSKKSTVLVRRKKREAWDPW